jgi:hypothetical protein
VANNYIYDCGNGCIHLDDPEGSQASLASVVNNVLKPGPSTPQRMAMIYGGWNMKTRTRIDGFGNDASGKPVWRSARGQQFSPVDRYQQCAVQVSPLTLRETVDVPGWVLRKAGARPADRDPVDERIIHNVRTGDGRIIDSVAEAGGFPDPEPHTRKLELPSDPHGDDDSDGYTNLEEWLHAMAAEVGG